MSTRRLTGIATLLLAFVTCLIAHAGRPAAAQGGPPGSGAFDNAIGLGVVYSPRPFPGADTEIQVVPVGNLRYGRFAFQGIRASYDLVAPGSRWYAQALAQPRFDGIETDESPFLEGMEERDLSLDVGFEAGWRSRRVGVSFTALADVLGRSDGVELQAELSFPRQLGERVRLVPQLSLSWQSSELVDYYYGVRPDEARSFRPAYEGRETLNPELGLLTIVQLAPRWQLFVLADLTFYGDGIQDSPIVEDERALGGVLGFTWAFRRPN